MASVNKVTLVGHLGRDPETRRLASGDPVVSLRLATSEAWTDKSSGERKEKTEWHSVVIFNENACRVAEQYLKKGSKVYVEGQLRTRKWQDQSGADKYTTEIVIARFKGEIVLLDKADRAPPSEDAYGTTRTREGGSTFGRKPDPRQAMGGSTARDIDDDIPF